MPNEPFIRTIGKLQSVVKGLKNITMISNEHSLVVNQQ